jgi:hypothetical protein
MFTDYTLNRKDQLLNDLIIVDGQPGSGKTLFTQIFGSFDRVEHFTYSTEIENICGLLHLEKITEDAATSMIKIQLDQLIYESMMGRNTNFRYTDLSSVFKSPKIFEYIKRTFEQGDGHIPNKIIQRKPILNILTHNLLIFSNPLFKSINRNIYFFEIQRHPLYMIIQQTLNHINFYNDENKSRQFHLCLKTNDKEFFYWNHEYIDEFFLCNPVERAILEIEYFTNKAIIFKQKNPEYIKNIKTINFENFVIDPKKYLDEILNFIQSKITKKTNKIMKKNKIPRSKISDSISLDIYKRCGWEPPKKNFSEIDELNLRRDFVIKNNARKKYVDIIDKLSYEYEKNYMSDILV